MIALLQAFIYVFLIIAGACTKAPEIPQGSVKEASKKEAPSEQPEKAQSTQSDQNKQSDQNNQSFQAWEDGLKRLFICDRNDATLPQKLPALNQEQTSILRRFLEKNALNSIRLTADEQNDFVREFDNYISLLENDNQFANIASLLKIAKLDLSTKISVYLTGRGQSTADSQKIADAIQPAINEVQAIKASGSAPRTIQVKPIASAVAALSSLLQKVHEENLVGSLFAFNSYKALFGDVPGAKEDQEGGGELFNKYSKMLFTEQAADGFQKAVLSGFFIDKRNALRALANSSPLYRKFLQHEVEKLSAVTPAQQNEKHLLQSVLRSDRFTILPGDPHVALFKAQFGNNILVDGIARGSVAAAYLISCRYEKNNRYFVVKTAVDRRNDLIKRLNEELKDLTSALLLKLYPGVASNTIQKAGQTDKEFNELVRTNVKDAILEDVNFALEAKNLYLLASAYQPYPAIILVRGIFDPMNGDQSLLMEYVPGTVLSDLKNLDQAQAQSFNKTLRELYGQIVFGSGPFHADMHAGNLIANGTTFTLIDAGRISDLDAAGRKSLQIFESTLDIIKSRAMAIDRSGDPNAPLFTQDEASRIFGELRKRINSEVRNKATLELPKAAEEIELIFQKSLLLKNHWFKKNKQITLRDQLLQSASFGPSDIVSALRALKAIESLYITYVEPHGLGGDYYKSHPH